MFNWLKKKRAGIKQTTCIYDLEEALVPLQIVNAMVSAFPKDETVEKYHTSLSSVTDSSKAIVDKVTVLIDQNNQMLNRAGGVIGTEYIRNYHKKVQDRVNHFYNLLRLHQEKEYKDKLGNYIQLWEVIGALSNLERISTEFIDFSRKIEAIEKQ